ncbi:MAG: hypothetical protein GY953_57245 [bacterium]|nr:hypothetical protein [bacterium]
MVAAILLGSAGAYSLLDQILTLSTAAEFWWFQPILLLRSALFLIPLPLLLALLYRNNATVRVPRGLKNLALATALVSGALVVAPGIYRWVQLMAGYWAEARWAEGTTVAGKIWNWGEISQARTWALHGVIVVSRLAVILFLVALVRHTDETPDAETRRSYVLREVAALATIVSGLAVVSFAVSGVVNSFAFSRILSTVTSLLPQACVTVTAYIVYKSLPEPTTPN